MAKNFILIRRVFSFDSKNGYFPENTEIAKLNEQLNGEGQDTSTVAKF